MHTKINKVFQKNQIMEGIPPKDNKHKAKKMLIKDLLELIHYNLEYYLFLSVIQII